MVQPLYIKSECCITRLFVEQIFSFKTINAVVRCRHHPKQTMAELVRLYLQTRAADRQKTLQKTCRTASVLSPSKKDVGEVAVSKVQWLVRILWDDDILPTVIWLVRILCYSIKDNNQLAS